MLDQKNKFQVSNKGARKKRKLQITVLIGNGRPINFYQAYNQKDKYV